MLQNHLFGPIMNYWERLQNGFGYILSLMIAKYENYLLNKFFQNIDANIPPLEELIRKSPICLAYNDEFILPTAPTLNKIINIGGIGIERTAKNLSQVSIF